MECGSPLPLFERRAGLGLGATDGGARASFLQKPEDWRTPKRGGVRRRSNRRISLALSLVAQWP